MLQSFVRYRNTGLMLLRFGLGLLMMMHGFPKMTGGLPVWTALGESMHVFNIYFYPEIWGFLAAFSEFVGGAFFMAGFLFRPACIFLAITMGVAASQELVKTGAIDGASHAMELFTVFLGLLFVGPGRFSLDAALFRPWRPKRDAPPPKFMW